MNSNEEASAATLTRELEQWVERCLRPYILKILAGDVQPRPKVVNDAIWGSIRLESWEVAVLDTPLMQRLRSLRQLGVVHWVYPSAGHTRFEHSLGVVHQMEALVAAIERTGNAGTPLVDDVTRKLLRIAALVHDCGHAVMCHVSEQMIDDLPGVDALRRQIHREFRSRKRPSSSECFAAVFVRSPAFRELLALPRVGASFIRDVDDATQKIAGLIVGGPVVPRAAFLTLLINGAFDADKLDYMPRDSQMAGVPCPVDVRRIIETVRVLEVPRAKVFSEYPKWAGLEDAAAINVLTLTSSGARVLEELAMARSLLYEKVYFHHKVRALEVMVRRGLHELKLSSVSAWLDLVDDALLLDTSNRSFVAIRARDLLKRAVVLTAPAGDDDTRNTDLERSWSELMRPGELDDLRAQLSAEAMTVARRLGLGTDALERQPPEVDAPPIKKFGLDQHAFVGDSLEQFAEANAALSGQRSEAGRRAARQCVYVFAPEGAVLPVFVAARVLLQKRYRIPLGPDAYRQTRLDPGVIRAAEARLEQLGYFGGAAPTPISDARIVTHRRNELETFLRTSWSRLEDLAVRFGQYQPYDAHPISPTRIAEFLRQFETEPSARSALLMLESVEFKDRKFFASSLEGRLATVPNAVAACPLGATGDSSAFLSYLMNDLPSTARREVLPLELALELDSVKAPGAQIVLWDDFCGRAGHTLTTLAQWLDLQELPEDKELLLREQLATKLTSQRMETFRSCDVTIAFAIARPSGIAAVKEYLKRHGLDRVRVLDPEFTLTEGVSGLFDTDRIIPDAQDRAALKEFLEVRMRRELASNLTRVNQPWSKEKLEDRLLGYGRESHLMVFSYNVPTVTLTALWMEGESWQPLFPRRSKSGT
jgi:HD superfamily phosphohydrolase